MQRGYDVAAEQTVGRIDGTTYGACSRLRSTSAGSTGAQDSPRPLVALDVTDANPIEATGLSRRFGEITAVEGVDLVVHPGEIYGFLGPNGAGKSTTVRMLTTLLKPSAGSARVAGFDVVSQASSVRRRIGVALQDAAIDPILTGRELLALQSVLHGIPKKVARVRTDELLAKVGLSAAADRRVGTYSGGMRRRLDLALSLVHEPAVLFLDEPTTGLDPTSRVALWDEVRRLNSEGATVMLTTQYLEEADQLAHRIGIIDRGRIVREGQPQVLKAQVGDPTLGVDVRADHLQAARQALAPYGPTRAARAGRVAIGLHGGSPALPSAIRALDDAGVEILHMQLDAPSLDDVFGEATGRRLEGAADGGADIAGSS